MSSTRENIADTLARHYDGQPLAELRDEHAAPHLEAATALLPLISDTEPAPRPSRFHATPAEVDAYLRTFLAEDVYLRFQQAIGYAALAEAVEDAATVRAQVDNDGLFGSAWREGWDDAILRVDPDQNDPTPSRLVTGLDDEQEREPDVDATGRTRESYAPEPACLNCGHRKHPTTGSGCPASSAPATCSCRNYTPETSA